MKRRDFLRKSAMASAGASCIPMLARGAARKKPNVLIIHTDQQSVWTLGAYGGDVVKTPHIDSLAEEGARLDNFFTNSAVCTASRGCFISGMYPHTNGAYKNNIQIRQDIEGFGHVFRKGGYDTGYIGKWHLDGDPKPGFTPKERALGFEDSRFMMNRGHWKKLQDQPDGTVKTFPYNIIGDKKTYTTDFLTDKALNFMKKDRGDKPFMLMLSFPDPHSPLSVRKPYDTMFNPEDMELPTTFDIPRPDWMSRDLPYGKDRKDRKTVLKRHKAQYYGMVKCIDDNVGRLIKKLKAMGQYDNTIIVFTSDHGEYLGEHGGLYGKNMFYENAYRVPFIVRWPRKIKAGTAIKEHVTTVDFKSTIAGLVGFSTNGEEQGIDTSNFLKGKKVKGHEDTAYFHHCDGEFAGIYDKDYSVGFFSVGKHVLFDRRKDPDQINNLAEKPEYSETLRQFHVKVLKHSKSVGEKDAKWLEKLKVGVAG
ncbi:sulfatase family protein [Fulvitalea axinellae]